MHNFCIQFLKDFRYFDFSIYLIWTVRLSNNFERILDFYIRGKIFFPQTFGKEPVHLRLQPAMAERVSSRASHRDVGSQVRVAEEGAEAEDRFDAGRQVQM